PTPYACNGVAEAKGSAATGKECGGASRGYCSCQAGSFATPGRLNAGNGAPLAWRRGGGLTLLRLPRPQRPLSRVPCRRQLSARVAPLKSLGFAILTLLCALAGADAAGAEDLLRSGLELRGGVLAHDVPDLWSGFRLERGVDVNGELLFGAGWSILG